MSDDHTKVEFQVMDIDIKEGVTPSVMSVSSKEFSGDVLDATVVLRGINMDFSDDHPLKRFIFNITNIDPIGKSVGYDIEPIVKDDGESYMSGTVETLIIATIKTEES